MSTPNVCTRKLYFISNILFQIIQPPPRKRYEKELHDRLEYLLTELEPWEQKLLQANKRAKIRLRKEHESYVEEPEPKVY